MEGEFLPYEESLTLKNLDFNEWCFAKFYYHELEIGGAYRNSEFKEDKKAGHIFTSAPLYQQVFRWFREKHKLDGRVISWKVNNEIVWYISTEPLGEPSRFKCYEVCVKTPEEADLTCIRKLLTLILK